MMACGTFTSRCLWVCFKTRQTEKTRTVQGRLYLKETLELAHHRIYAVSYSKMKLCQSMDLIEMGMMNREAVSGNLWPCYSRS